MTFILTNDDGIDAPGIQALLKAVSINHHDVIIAAPKDHLSGCGHQVTTTRPIHVQKRSETEFAIDGTPADCIRIAKTHIKPDVKWVLSGINAGGNMGVDVYISGTVAAVREAAMHGIGGIAISQYHKGKLNFDWDAATRWTSLVIADLLARPLEPGSFWNVNLPHLLPGEPEPEVVFCQPCTKPLPVEYRIEGEHYQYIGNYQQRVSEAPLKEARTPNSDVEACFSGKIAITKLRL
jgi:5'-nucleotidase